MTRKCKLAFVTVLFFLSSSIFAAQSDWVIGAQKFTYARNQTDPVSDGIAVMFPSRILEKLKINYNRILAEDEKAERELYKLRQDRNSLFLQLSAEIKRRDSLVLAKYSQSELNRKIEEEKIKIQELKEKINENTSRQKELLTIIENSGNQELNAVENDEINSRGQNTSFIANLFSNDKKITNENVVLYNNDISSLFNPSQKAIEAGLKSSIFEKEVVNARINCLITGKISLYDEYLSITVESYVFPGSKKISSVMEYGSLDDADFIAFNIARQLAPSLSNSMPVEIKINILTELQKNALNTYIDDVLYNDSEEVFTIDSGVHFIQFTADGYKSVGTNYYFEGNKAYEINVELEKIEPKVLFLIPKATFEGEFLVNGKSATPLTDGASKITINGNAVLGEFLTEDNNTSFFYISQKKLESNLLYTVNVNPINSSDFIEKRRRTMYLSYSILVTSLIPTIASNGKNDNYQNLLKNSSIVTVLKTKGNYDKVAKEAKMWSATSLVFSGVSIACGIWFIYELYRYFDAANSVLPVSSKITFGYKEAPPLPEKNEAEDVAEESSENETADESESTENNQNVDGGQI